MSNQYGVSVSYYGGMSFEHAALMKELRGKGIKDLVLRGAPYPEVARAEQVRQALLSNVDVTVFLDASVGIDVESIEELVKAAADEGIAVPIGNDWSRALDCAAVHRDVLVSMIEEETRRYSNSVFVDTPWNNDKVPAVPVASPWNRDGSSLIKGDYLTDSEAFFIRASRAGNDMHRVSLSDVRMNHRSIRTSITNADKPITQEPGSRFALCIPSFGSLDYDQNEMAGKLERAGMTVVRIHDCPWIDQGRSWLTEQAMALGKGIFFLDHDIMFDPNDVLRLCEQALERNAVVAAPYSMRRSGRSIIGSFDLPPGKIKFFKNGSTVPAFYSGLGFAAIPFDVLNSIALPSLVSYALAGVGRNVACGSRLAGKDAEDDAGRRTQDASAVRIRPWYALDCSTGFYAGEDVSFCNRVHDLTVRQIQTAPGEEVDWEMTHSGRPARVFLDTRIRIAHRGVYDYGIEDVGIVVPRCEELEAEMFTTRAEARQFLVKADSLPVDMKLDMLNFEREAGNPKAEALVLEEEASPPQLPWDCT